MICQRKKIQSGYLCHKFHRNPTRRQDLPRDWLIMYLPPTFHWCNTQPPNGCHEFETIFQPSLSCNKFSDVQQPEAITLKKLLFNMTVCCTTKKILTYPDCHWLEMEGSWLPWQFGVTERALLSLLPNINSTLNTCPCMVAWPETCSLL